ncbi:cytochrome P450 [Nocardia salmonicida]|uniref:cytochrome P450 n=1 Tax=Nocardia salmonicida TaxID=53431 RepID=UPI003634C3E5
MHQHLKDWGAEHGSRYRVNLFGTKLVVFADSTAIQQILKDRPRGFRRAGSIESVFTEIGIDGLFSVEGAKWKRRRRLVTPAFNPTKLRGFGDTLDSITARLRKQWLRGNPDVHADLMRYTVDVMTNVAFGYDLNTLEGGGDAIERRLQEIFPALGRRAFAPFPYWRYLKLPADRRLDAALRALRQEIGELIADCRGRLAEHPTNFIEALLLAQEGDDPLTDDELFAEALTVLVTGQDTTANSLAWLLYHLAVHPHVQDRLRAEVLAGEERSYLDAVVQESMRVQPVAPLLVLDALEDVTIDGVDIPKGMSVIVAMGRAAVGEVNFDAPQEFQPERWLPGAAGTRNAKAATPFGAGPRFCPGQALALMEIDSVIRMLMREFEVTVPAAAPAPKELFTVAVAPEELRLTFTPR